jgi:uridine kinase
MQQHTRQVQSELIELKNTYREHSENFVREIKALNDQLIKYVNETHLSVEFLTETTKSH